MTRHWLQIATRAVERHDAIQDPRELAILLSLLDGELPYSVLEIGTWRGGSAWAWGQIPGVGQIITVDHAPKIGTEPMIWDHPVNLCIVEGDSRDEATRGRVEFYLANRPADVLFIDGDHRYPAVRRDWELYGPLVRPGGLAVFHDIEGTDEGYEIGVPRLWAELGITHRTTAIASHRGVKYGTGLVWL